MRKILFIWTCMVGLAVAGTPPSHAQEILSADRLVVTDVAAGRDSVQVIAGMESLDNKDLNAAERLDHIWREIDQAGDIQHKPDAGKRISPWSFSTSLGTSFLSFPGHGSAMTMFAAPRVNFSATERLGLHAGVSVGRTLPVMGPVNSESFINPGMTTFSGYVAASYMLTENLVIHGSGSRNALLMPVDGELQPMQFNDLSFGATYHFGNFSIGATIHRSDGPVFGAPFGGGNNMFGTPFYW